MDCQSEHECASFDDELSRFGFSCLGPITDLVLKELELVTIVAWKRECWVEAAVSCPSHNLSGNGRAATSWDTDVTN